MSSRNLAQRRNDRDTVKRLNAQIITLGGDPDTGTLIDGLNEGDEYDLKIQKINEFNKKRAKAAQAAAGQRRREQEQVMRERT